VNADWNVFCRTKGFVVDGEAINVQLADARSHRIYVSNHKDEYLIFGLIARPSLVRKLDDPMFVTWMRNRNSELVSFRINHKECLIGEAWVPKAGLTSEEFQLYVRTVAVDCDRLESILTGKDAY
jgi:hypothetical protein